MRENFRVGHPNVRSINTGFNHLVNLIKKYEFHIFALSETWLNEQTLDEGYRIEGYNFFRRDRATRGGGLAMYVSNKIKANVVNTDTDDSVIEQLWVNCKLNQKSFSVCVFYRPPTANLLQSIENLDTNICYILSTVKHVICLGDINHNLLIQGNVVSNYFDDLGFEQIIKEPTRTCATSSTLLDPIFVSDKELVASAGVVDADDISDHSMCHCELNMKIRKFQPKLVTYRDFSSFNFDNFNTDLLSAPWNNIIYENNMDQKVILFNSIILALFDLHAPLREARVTKPKCPWITDVIKRMTKERDRAKTRFKRSRSDADWNTYKNLRNFTLTAIRREKKIYLDRIFLSGDKKRAWKSLYDLNVNNKNNIAIPDSLKDVERINNYFGSVFEEGNCSEYIDYYKLKTPITNNTFNFTLATTEEINNILRQLKSNAYGMDGISLTMLRYCSPLIDQYIAHIINCSIEANYFPTPWKFALITPLAKTKEPKEYSDLRPVSVLPVLSKILEKVLYRQIYEFVSTNNILATNQSGFRKGYSTTSTMLNVLDDIETALDNKKVACLITLDYSKAFDTINHDLLCEKLKYYGFSPQSVAIISCYLKGRTQCVKIDNHISSATAIASGVPQGSVLSSLLFIIYTTELLNNINNLSVNSYADDTQLCATFYPDQYLLAEQVINNELEKIKSISSKHNLRLNPAKSILTYFGNFASDRINIRIDGISVPVSSMIKSLGITIDQQLKFSPQISNLVKKSMSKLKILYSNRNILNKTIRSMLAETLVLSHFNYGCYVYGPFLTTTEQRRVQKVKNSCCRFVCGLRRYDHVSEKIVELGWLNMKNRRELQFATFVHNVMITNRPSYLRLKLSERGSQHGVNIRNASSLSIPMHRTSLFTKCFSYQAVATYNKIPPVLKSLSISSFKFKYKAMLLNEQ